MQHLITCRHSSHVKAHPQCPAFHLVNCNELYVSHGTSTCIHYSSHVYLCVYPCVCIPMCPHIGRYVVMPTSDCVCSSSAFMRLLIVLRVCVNSGNSSFYSCVYTPHYFRDEVCVHIVERTKADSFVDIWLLCVCHACTCME